jgi:hypothetical protein
VSGHGSNILIEEDMTGTAEAPITHPEEMRAASTCQIGKNINLKGSGRLTPAGIVTADLMTADLMTMEVLLATAALVRAARPGLHKAAEGAALPFRGPALFRPSRFPFAQQYRCDTRCDRPLLERYQQLPFLQ